MWKLVMTELVQEAGEAKSLQAYMKGLAGDLVSRASASVVELENRDGGVFISKQTRLN